MNPLLPIEYWLLGTALLLTAGGWVAWRAAARVSPRVRAIIVAARLLGLLGLAVLALNPGRWASEAQTQAAEWAVVVDRSASMQTADVAGRARWAEAGRLAARVAGLARAPERLRLCTFAGDIEEAARAADLARRTPDGARTDIERVALSLLSRYQGGGKRLSGVLLLSDGRRTADETHAEVWARARAQETPFHVLPLGGDVRRPDLSVAVAQRQVVAFTGQTARIVAQVRNERLGNIRPVVRLLDAAGRTVAEQTVELADNQTRPVVFDVQPPRTGYFIYAVAATPWPGETVEANNTARFGLTVLAAKLRVFFAEGAPFWDSKFLAQMLRRQATVEVTSLYRVSAERFFQVRVEATNSGQVAESVFPDDEAALARYDLLICGKGCEYFLTPERIERLKRYVREQGGRVLFARGKPYAADALPALEPLEPVTWGPALPNEFSLRPRAEARSAGLFGDMLPGADAPVWATLAPLRNANQCPALKPFTEVHADGVFGAAGHEVTFPLIVSRRYGRGLVMAVNAEGFWQWDFFPRQQEAGRLYQELWMQMLNWAVTRAEFLPGQDFALSLGAATAHPGVPVRVRLGRRTGATAVTPRALEVWRGGERVQELSLSGAPDQPEHEAVLTLAESGLYRIVVAGVPDVSATLQILPPAGEADNVSADPEYLKRIAALSGGRVVTEDELPALVRALEGEPEQVDLSKAVWVPAWDRAWLCALLAACFAVEWFLRRRSGLV